MQVGCQAPKLWSHDPGRASCWNWIRLLQLCQVISHTLKTSCNYISYLDTSRCPFAAMSVEKMVAPTQAISGQRQIMRFSDKENQSLKLRNANTEEVYKINCDRVKAHTHTRRTNTKIAVLCEEFFLYLI